MIIEQGTNKLIFMKIFFVSRGYPTKQHPQWGCFEFDQARALKRLGHEVVMISVDIRFRPYRRKFGITKTEKDGIGLVDIFVCPDVLSKWLGARCSDKFKSWQLLQVYKQAVKLYGKPDIVYAHYLWNIALAIRVKEKYKVPVVGMEHWSKLNEPVLNSMERYMGNVAYNGADKIIAVSDSLRIKIKKHFGIDSIVVHNMIGEEFVNNQVISPNKDKLIFISVGSLIHRKGYDILIDAMKSISDKIPAWELWLVGDGSEYMHLQRKIDDYKLSAQIKLFGRKNKTEIIKLLSVSSVYISASRSENFSVSILEALSAGLPVIATLCGGIKECIDKKNGILVPVEDVKGMATAISEIAKNIGHYNRMEIHENCKLRFAPQVIAQQLTSIFEEVIKNVDNH